MKRTGLFFILYFMVFVQALEAKPNILQDYYVEEGNLVLSFFERYKDSSQKVTRGDKTLTLELTNTVLAKGVSTIRMSGISLKNVGNSKIEISFEAPAWYVVHGTRPLLSWRQYHIPLPKSVLQALKPNIIPATQANKQQGLIEKIEIVESDKTVAIDIENKIVTTPQEKSLFDAVDTQSPVVATPIPAAKAIAVKPQSKATKVVKTPTKKSTSPAIAKKVIVIDAGHGGHDPGATYGGKHEKTVALAMAKKLKKEIEARGHTVYMTRSTDVFIDLKKRTKVADKKNADVFISIHANAIHKSKAATMQGIETFFLSNARDERSQNIAARENASVLKGTSSTTKKVLIDSVLSGPKVVESNKLAIVVHGRVMKNLKAHYPVKDGGVRSAPFYVLVGASRPSILIETGYISHPTERKRLFNAHYQKYVAKGIAQGIESYFYFRQKELGF